jgi:predicted Na+-dependent transporter
MVIVLLIGMAASTTIADYKKAWKKPRAMIIGMFSQFVLMPLIALMLTAMFDLEPAYGIGLVVVGCTPGGTTSQLFTYWADGDVSLSLSMTITSSTAALVLMPHLVKGYAKNLLTDLNVNKLASCLKSVQNTVPYTRADNTIINKHCWDSNIGQDAEDKCFADWTACDLKDAGSQEKCFKADLCDSQLEVKAGMIVTTLAAMLVAVVVGLYARKKSRRVAASLVTVGSVAGCVVILVLIVYGSIVYSYMWEVPAAVYLCAILIGFFGFFFGYGMSKVSPSRTHAPLTVRGVPPTGSLTHSLCSSSPCLRPAFAPPPCFAPPPPASPPDRRPQHAPVPHGVARDRHPERPARHPGGAGSLRLVQHRDLRHRPVHAEQGERVGGR